MLFNPLINFLRPHMKKVLTPCYYSNHATMNDKIVWVDLEMTGLDIEKDSILEIACCVTDFTLKDVIKGPNLVIKTSDDKLLAMDQWCTTHHLKSGLTDLCRTSEVTLAVAEEAALSFIKQHVKPGVAPLAGNTIYMDRLFLMKHMPKFNAYMHYRIIDVSSFKEVFKRWAPLVAKNSPPKSFKHRALDDILCSIEELRHYGVSIFELP